MKNKLKRRQSHHLISFHPPIRRKDPSFPTYHNSHLQVILQSIILVLDSQVFLGSHQTRQVPTNVHILCLLFLNYYYWFDLLLEDLVKLLLQYSSCFQSAVLVSRDLVIKNQAAYPLLPEAFPLSPVPLRNLLVILVVCHSHCFVPHQFQLLLANYQYSTVTQHLISHQIHLAFNFINLTLMAFHQ